MKGLYKVLPPFAPDYGGACEVMYELGGMILIHDASGCTVNYVHFDEPRYFTEPSAVFCSGLNEIDAVMGDDSVVIGKALKAAEKLHPKFISFVGSSVPMVVGTDFKGLAAECEAKCGIPCFGFAVNGIGTCMDGASKVYLEFIKRFSGDRTEAKGVNLLGLLPMSYSSVAETEKVRSMFKYLRYSPGFMSTFENFSDLQNAEENVVVSSSGLEAADYMKKKYGIPYRIGIDYDEDYIRSIVGNVTSGKNVLVIGEGVEACSFSDSLKKYGMVKAASVLDIFEQYDGAEYRLSDESEIKDVIGQFDVVVADPYFKSLSENTEFINRPMIAVSGGAKCLPE